MALVNYFRNPRFKTDSNSDGFADGIDNSWPSFEGVNKPSGMILPINGVGGGPLTNRGVTDYCQFLEYDYLSDEGSLAYIHIGETAAGSIAIKNITSVTNTGQPTTLSSTGHGLHAGERIEVTGITTSPAAISGQENVYDAPTPDTFRIDVNVTTVTDGVGTFQPKGIFTLRMMADHMLLNQGGIPGGSGTLRVGIDQMNSSGGRVGNVSGGTVYYNFAAPDTWQTLSAYIPTLDATCDHLRFWIQLASLGTTGERIRMWISHACFTKMNGGLNWFDGVYGGTWDGTADASTSTQDEIAVVETVTPQGAIAGRPFSFMGSDFGWSGTMVWDATPVTATNWEPNVVSGTVPNIADGHYDVVFTPAEGGGAINYSAPGEIDVGTSVVVTSITPNSGVAGTPFVIAGSGLGTSGTVRFTSGSISRDATITSWNDTEIRGTAPTGLPTGAATVNVLIGGTTSSNLTYTYPATGSYELKVKTASLWQNQPVLWTR